MEDIGLEEITNKDNLYTLAQDNAIKITKITSNTHNKVTLTLKASQPTPITLNSGTLLFPEDRIASSTQTLIIRDDLSTTVSDC